ncbi:MAG TPA: cytochrome c oxidase subunit II [Blastocatellia bacterium]|nr:cytochrome c oxidase subunit II [Blastocatellia bacterium]
MWEGFPLFPESASTIAGTVDRLYFFLIGVAIFFSLLIGSLVFIFAIKYRRRTENETPRPIVGSLKLELVWTIIPFILAMIMYAQGVSVYFETSRPPSGAMEIYVVGKQWMWKLQHPNGRREINELHVPVGMPIKLTMTSEDVIHSFYVPAFRIKMDVLPGRYTTTWFQATKTGRFHLFCAEYCGTKHSGMIGWVIVMEPSDFEEWLRTTPPPAAPRGLAGERPPLPVRPGESLAAVGERLFQQLGCNSCHLPEPGGQGPPLTGIFGRRITLEGGETVVADETYLRESIINPMAKIVSGYPPIMPPFQGKLTEEELVELIEYIKSLGRGERTTSQP